MVFYVLISAIYYFTIENSEYKTRNLSKHLFFTSHSFRFYSSTFTPVVLKSKVKGFREQHFFFFFTPLMLKQDN